MRTIRLAVRTLRRRPAFTVAALLTLTLGIGATTAMFSVVRSILFRPLPYAEPDRQVVIWPGTFLGNREVDYLRRNARSFDAVGSFSPGWLMGLTGVAEPTQISAGRISGNLLQVLGVTPALGRGFGMESETPGQDNVVVLSDGLWRKAFGADPTIVGRSIQLDLTPYTVLGVMPRGFQILDTDTDLWTPLPMDRTAMFWEGQVTQMLGRLAPGITLEAANAEFRVLADAMRGEYHHPDDWARSARVEGWLSTEVGGVRTLLLVLLGAVGFLLLIAAANVANLLLERTEERRHEFAVRLALGASPRMVATALLGESLTLAVLGGIGGVALAFGALRLAPAVLPPDVPRVSEIAVDGTVLGVTAGLTLLTALLFGLAPALHAARGAPVGWLRGTRGSSADGGRTRGALIAVEAAMALILLAGTGLMIRTVRALSSVDPGFRPDHLLTLQLQPSGDRDELATFMRSVIERIHEVPGVNDVASVLHLPTGGRKWLADIEVEGRPLPPGSTPPRSAWQSISPAYMRTAGIPLITGRDFGPEDRKGSPRVVLVNTAFAKRLFPGGSPIGERIKGGYATQRDWATIVGVVGSVRHDSLSGEPGAEFYVPYEQNLVVASSLVIRTRGNPAAFAPAVVAAIRGVRAETPISNVRTMDDLLDASIRRQKSVLSLLGLFALLGLVLGAVGIYGVVAYGARRRSREIGIRVALGANAGSVIGLVVRDGVRWAIAGMLIGLPLALALSGLLRGLIYGVPTTDPVSFGVAIAGFVAVALFASWIPARRAARADPTVVLREE